MTLGSLSGRDLRDLEELGLLPKEAVEDAENNKERFDSAVVASGTRELRGEGNEGLPWFDTMVEGSRLGRVRKSWGQRTAGDGNSRFTVEWEIMEWTEGDEVSAPGKRKIGELEESDAMEH